MGYTSNTSKKDGKNMNTSNVWLNRNCARIEYTRVLNLARVPGASSRRTGFASNIINNKPGDLLDKS
jgi:hypothetical protein